MAAEVAGAKAELAAALTGLPGVRVWPSAAGIAMRRAETFPGLSRDHLRVAVRPPADNHRLLAALADALW